MILTLNENDPAIVAPDVQALWGRSTEHSLTYDEDYLADMDEYSILDNSGSRAAKTLAFKSDRVVGILSDGMMSDIVYFDTEEDRLSFMMVYDECYL